MGKAFRNSGLTGKSDFRNPRAPGAPASQQSPHGKGAPSAASKALEQLSGAVLDYLSEVDNPVADYGYRITLRNRLRELVGAPPAPPPRKL